MIESSLLVFLFAFSIWYLGSPFLKRKNYQNLSFLRRKKDLMLQKDEVLYSLKDLELDYKTGKISKEDFDQMYEQTFKEGTRLLKEIDDENN